MLPQEHFSNLLKINDLKTEHNTLKEEFNSLNEEYNKNQKVVEKGEPLFVRLDANEEIEYLKNKMK